MKEAVFGVKLANKKYQDRFGAYGIVVNEKQEMVIIQAQVQSIQKKEK